MDARTTAHLSRTTILVLMVLVAAGALLGLATAAAAARAASSVPSEPAYQGPLAADARAALGAPAPGSGGWYWPIGTEDFKGWSGWLEPRGAYVHVAQDMPCSYGHAVYAIGDGVVFISRADAGGYGVGGANGGCIIITHTTAAGTEFQALYGHVYGLKVKEGERVTAGQVIARVNGCRHLHFSTHRGTTYRDRNPYVGHVPRSWPDHGGFVDPVKFLKTNPRAATYRPPELPWTEVGTTSPPLQYGAADGAAYWTEEGGAGSVTWRLDLASGERRALAAGEVVPLFDARRYEAIALAAPAVGFSVADHLPVVTLEAEHATPPWGEEAELVATLANAAGAPLQGGILKLQRFHTGRWQDALLAVTDAEGAATFLHLTSGGISLRAVFAPPAEPEAPAYLAARSATEIVTPHVVLTTPRVPRVVRAAALATLTGDLTPHHPVGTRSVELVLQRRGEGGAWVTKATIAAINRDRAGGEATRYVGHARLTAGSWRVQATHPGDEAHALSTTSWRAFTVE